MPAAIFEVLGIAVHGFSIFNIYNPLSNPLTSTTLDFLSNFTKVILCGFNAHHGMWGSEYTNCSGRSLVEALDVHDLLSWTLLRQRIFHSLDVMHGAY